eukprot:5039255-Prymnesium_polylepis.1
MARIWLDIPKISYRTEVLCCRAPAGRSFRVQTSAPRRQRPAPSCDRRLLPPRTRARCAASRSVLG